MTPLSSIPLGRRISEILQEKGISPNAFSQRIGMGKDTFYSCIKGDRYIKPSELSLMASKLNLTSDRILQRDNEKEFLEVRSLLERKVNIQRALELAQHLFQSALGWTEKFDLLNDIGTAYHHLKDYEQAHRAWVAALPYAEKIHTAYGEYERLFRITKNLIISYTQRNDFAKLTQILAELEPSFENSNPDYAGALSYSHAMVALKMGDKELCRDKLYQQLRFNQMMNVTRAVGIAHHNVSYIEYLHGNYEVARSHSEKAMDLLIDFPDLYFESVKDFVRILWHLDQFDLAREKVVTSLESVEEFNLPEARAKLLVLKALTHNDATSAESIFSIGGLDEKIYLLACHFLLDFCRTANDAEGLLRYYKIMKRYDKSPLSVWEGI